MNNVTKELYKALIYLSKEGIVKHNLYKFFIPTRIENTIRDLDLNCKPEELMEEWKKYNHKL
jgi:hypothetical protein